MRTQERNCFLVIPKYALIVSQESPVSMSFTQYSHPSIALLPEHPVAVLPLIHLRLISAADIPKLKHRKKEIELSRTILAAS